MEAIIEGQVATVKVLAEKQGLFGPKVLVSFFRNNRDESGTIYSTTNNAKWIPKRNLLPEPN